MASETDDTKATGAGGGQRGGMPGDGAGRIEETGHSGVYPVSSSGGAGGEAPIRGEASWGQGERGAAGYEDHGTSEAMTIPPGDPSDLPDDPASAQT